MRKLAAGNWKMNGTGASLSQIDLMAQAGDAVDVLICPPTTLINSAAGRGVAIGGQDCHAKASGAHTGDISAEQLADAGASYVILGHSERRTDHGETDAQVHAKAEAAWRAGLISVICVGETLAEREAGHVSEVVTRQVANSVPDGATGANTVIAYEPVWAIGTGKVPTTDQIQEVHDLMRDQLVSRFGAAAAEFRLLYGGSVKADNAAQIFAVRNVDGALVGGASLTAKDFVPIISALASA